MSLPENSLENIPLCNIFYPSEEEFKNFEKYVTKCQNKCKSGIFKIVSPKSYKPRKDNYKNLEFNIPYPIEQVVTGTSGIYEVILIQKEARSLSKYKKLVQTFDTLTENKSNLEIEKLFWKNLKFSAPLYGADSPGSLFDKEVPWNLSEIDSILKRGLDKGGILGVTSPYVYIGAWKTLFAWHKEDMDLYSINYNHFGKPKFWYGIPLEENQKFEDFMRKSFPEAFRECPEFLRHKTFLVHPEILMKNGIKMHKCVQNPGEFVITLAGGYHCGFNAGFNIAEAVNFALKNWIDLGKNALSCKCRGDSVNINMDNFVDNLKRKNSNISQLDNNLIIPHSFPNTPTNIMTASPTKISVPKRRMACVSKPIRNKQPFKILKEDVKKNEAKKEENIIAGNNIKTRFKNKLIEKTKTKSKLKENKNLAQFKITNIRNKTIRSLRKSSNAKSRSTAKITM